MTWGSVTSKATLRSQAGSGERPVGLYPAGCPGGEVDEVLAGDGLQPDALASREPVVRCQQRGQRVARERPAVDVRDLDVLGEAQERDVECAVAHLVGEDVAAAGQQTDPHLRVFAGGRLASRPVRRPPLSSGSSRPRGDRGSRRLPRRPRPAPVPRPSDTRARPEAAPCPPASVPPTCWCGGTAGRPAPARAWRSGDSTPTARRSIVPPLG